MAYKPYISRSGTGAKTYGTTISVLCYAAGDVTVVKDKDGKEIVSTKQLFVDGSCTIKELDSVTFEGRENEVRSISYFYRRGAVDLKVVYL